MKRNVFIYLFIYWKKKKNKRKKNFPLNLLTDYWTLIVTLRINSKLMSITLTGIYSSIDFISWFSYWLM